MVLLVSRLVTVYAFFITVASAQNTNNNNRLYDIGPPVMTYQGLELDLAYTVRNSVTPNIVGINLYSDPNCTFSIDSAATSYITESIIPDLTPVGDGSGTRQVRFWGAREQQRREGKVFGCVFHP